MTCPVFELNYLHCAMT